MTGYFRACGVAWFWGPALRTPASTVRWCGRWSDAPSAPDAPSRLPAAFVFEEFDTAQAFRSDRPEYVYVVRFDAALRTHQADMSLIDVATRHRSVADVEAIVRRYWAGEIIDPKQVEVLVDGELEVVERLTGPDRPAA